MAASVRASTASHQAGTHELINSGQRATSGRGGRVRAARLTDLATVSELSRQAHNADDKRMRTLGLPVSSGQIGVGSPKIVGMWLASSAARTWLPV